MPSLSHEIARDGFTRMTDPVTTLGEGLTGRYTIEREIGRGGMATVYLARDLRHDRHVALKVLDPELGAVLGAERFLAEIKVTASLQHPNLLPLFDSGAVGGLLFYVMPFIEGESLRHRLDRERQLPVDEVVAIGAGVAKALAYAHVRGVIHRDLKPENVLLQSGQPLVADFGIALAVSNAGGTRITQTGLSLGTPQYMSPEQATGDRAIDARSDIYALGAMLYEMLTGEPPHTGATVQVIMAKVLTDTPRSVRLARPGVPPHVEAAIACALEKVPADRFSTAERFAEALEGKVDVMSGTTARARAETPTTRSWTRTAAVVLPWILLAGTIALWLTRSRTEMGQEITRSVISYDGLQLPEDLLITPDGSRIVFTAESGGQRHLYIRSLGELAPRQVAGTAGAADPFVSPDSRTIGFFIGSRLKRMAVSGGPIEDIGQTQFAPNSYRSATWTRNNELVLNSGGALHLIPAGGGAADTITDESGKPVRGAWPVAAPDGDFVFLMKGGPAGPEDDLLAAVSLRTGRTIISSVPTREVAGAMLGHVFFRREDGALMAVPYDATDGSLTGEPIAVLESARSFSISTTGSVVYFADSGYRNLVMRAGDSTRTLWSPPWPRPHTPRLSPDGRYLSLGRERETWVYDLVASTPARIAAVGQQQEWSADGKRVLYLYQPLPGMKPTLEIRWRVRDGSEPEETLFRSDSIAIRSAVQANDGSLYLALSRNRAGIWKVNSGDTALVQVLPEGTQPRVSPDGKWLAYVSTESGDAQVYVRPTSGSASRLVVSADGGQQPVWDRTGRKLYYTSDAGVVRATLETDPALRVVRRELVLSAALRSALTPQFDVAMDGQRLLVLEPRLGNARIVLVQNFLPELRARLSAKQPGGSP